MGKYDKILQKIINESSDRVSDYVLPLTAAEKKQQAQEAALKAK
ncbi:hypothetical protein [Methylovulum psychrotolerans]|nr:hypothetical protein [Methylovulum psychrotolerans]